MAMRHNIKGYRIAATSKAGSRATTYIDPRVVRSGSRKVESQKHITSYIIVNGADEVGPYTAIFDSSCDDEEDRKLNVGWLAGLPRVNCRWGFPEEVTCEPIVLVTPKGGTCEDALEKSWSSPSFHSTRT